MKIMLDLFEKQLHSLYNSEVLVLNGLPEMLDYATDEKLKVIIDSYIKETHTQQIRLEEIARYLKIKITEPDGKIIRGLLGELEELYEEFPRGLLMDAGLIAKMQQIEHFQISAYESAILYAKSLEIKEVVQLLQETLNEAYEADEECSYYAKKLILNEEKNNN